MTLPWSKMPRALRGDWRLTQRSPEAIAAFFLAWLAADDDGSIGPAGSTPAVEALAAQLSTHRPGDPLGWAVEAVTECLDAGLLESLDDGDALRVVDWLDAPAMPAPEPTTSPEGDRPAAEKRAPGRPRSASPMTPAERQERRRFDRRERGFRDVPAGVTWEQWREANLVTKTPASGHENYGAGHENPPSGHENSGHENSPSPHASGPEDQKETRNKAERESGTRAAGHENPGHGNSTGHENPPSSFRDQPRCSTVELVSPFDADEVLSRMGKTSGGRIAAMATTPQMVAFGALARDLISRGHATVDGLVKAAGHAPHVPWIARDTKPLTVERLCDAGGKILVELITGAATCKDCGGDPMQSGTFLAPQRDRNGRPIAPAPRLMTGAEYRARREATVPKPVEAPEVSRAR